MPRGRSQRTASTPQLTAALTGPGNGVGSPSVRRVRSERVSGSDNSSGRGGGEVAAAGRQSVVVGDASHRVLRGLDREQSSISRNWQPSHSCCHRLGRRSRGSSYLNYRSHHGIPNSLPQSQPQPLDQRQPIIWNWTATWCRPHSS